MHIQQTGHNATSDNFNIIGREDRDLVRTIKEAIYIRVNNPSLNWNVGKYHLSHLWIFISIYIGCVGVDMVQLISWTSHLLARASVAMGEYLVRLQVVLLVFSIGMFRLFGVLWSILCRISRGMTPISSWNASKFNSYRLLVSGTSGVLLLQLK